MALQTERQRPVPVQKHSQSAQECESDGLLTRVRANRLHAACVGSTFIWKGGIKVEGCVDGRSQRCPGKWHENWNRQTRRASAARTNGRQTMKLNVQNLVPQPDPDLWQTTPEAPFQELCSEDARGKLSRCNLISAMKKHQDLALLNTLAMKVNLHSREMIRS